MAFSKIIKSDRILQSRRFTQDKNPDSSEVFTRVLDLNASEIYSQQNLIPTSSLPFSGSGQNGYYYTSDGQVSTTATGQDILRYRYRQRLTPSNTYNDGEGTTQNTWFFLDTYAGSAGVSPGILQSTQGANFISPKYAPTQGNNAEQDPPGYQVILTQGGVLIDPALYTFDYKTGVLEFNGQSGLINSSDIRLTAYQYVGRTLSSDQTQGYSGSFSGSFQGDGTGLTNIPASGIVGLNLTQIATSDTTASVSSGGTAFTLTRSSNPVFTVASDGGYTALGNSAITGSLEISQNLVVQGTASFGRINSVTGSAKIIGDAFIILNSDLPVSRYAGILVEDSGSALGQTGSLLYDAEADHWFYDSTTEGYASGFIAGPRATRDNITWPSRYAVTRGDGGNHIVNSNIYSTGSNVTVNKGATGSLAGVEILGDLEVTGSVRITAGASGSFSGSFEGDGAGLTNLPASSIVGLNLTQIADTVVSASVSSAGGNIFTITNGGSTRFTIGDDGEITAVSTASLREVSITGSATISGNLISKTSLTVSGSTILSGSTNLEGTNSFSGITSTSGSTILSGSVVIISDSEVTGSINVLGSTNTVGTSTIVGDMIITGSLTVSGSSTLTNIGPAEFTGSTSVLGTLNIDGISSTVGTSLVTGSAIISGSTSIEGPVRVVGSTIITGSTLLPSPDGAVSNKYALVTSQSAWHYSDNVGYPAGTNQWNSGLNGSYFNIFTPNTDTATILRFLAGLLSSSAPAPTPNTRTYDTVTGAENSLGSTATVSVISDQRLSLGYTSSAQISQAFKDTINYGITKGWSATGSDNNGEGTQPWKQAGAAYYQNFSTYNFRFTSNASLGTGGNGSDFFDLGTLDPVKDLKVRLIGSMSFSDTASVTAPNASTGLVTQTKTLDFSRSVGDTTALDGNGLGLATIYTTNPAVIPNTYQDARFFEVGKTAFLTRSFGTSLVADNTVSSSGYYRFYGMQAGITSGSSTNYIFKTTSDTTRLWLPISAIQTSMSATPASITGGTFASSSLTIAPSRSYSGVPYLTAGTSTWTYLGTGSGMFDPAFLNGVVFRQSISETLPGTVLIAGSSNSDVSCNTSGIATSGKVYDASGNVKNSGLPRINDEVRSNVGITHSIGSGDSNITETGFSTGTTFTATTLGFTYTGSTGANLNTSTFPYHQAGTYGQPTSSGSLGIYGGGTSNSVSIEYFTSESYRRVISNSTTLTTQWNESTALTLGNKGDLQVKPSTTTGYLVNPESAKGYWYPTAGYDANHYKWYMREITTNATANRGSITLDFDPNTSADFVAFDSTTNNKIALGLIFEYQVAERNAGRAARVVMFDVIKGNGSYGGSLDNQATSAQLNPFSDNIDIQANFSSISNSSGTITLGLNNGVNQTINGTYTKVWLLVRYKGTPDNSLQKFTVTVA